MFLPAFSVTETKAQAMRVICILLLLLACSSYAHAIQHKMFGDGCRVTGDAIVRFDRFVDSAESDPVAALKVNESDIAALFASNIQFAELSETHFGCSDAHYSAGTVSTAGGDAGEFLTALSVVSSYSVPIDSSPVVSRLLSEYLKFSPPSRKFYMHTTTAANRRLCDKISADVNMPLDCHNFDIKSMPVELHEQIISDLSSNTSFIGCRHILGIMTDPVSYGTRQDIVQNFLAAFYRLYLSNSVHLIYEVTADDVDDDIAVLQISSNGCADSFAALIRSQASNNTNTSATDSTNQNEDSNSQTDNQVRVIVHHEKAQRVLREELAEFFHRTFPEQIVDRDNFRWRMNRLYDSQLDQTLKTIVPGLPIFQIEVQGERFELPRNDQPVQSHPFEHPKSDDDEEDDDDPEEFQQIEALVYGKPMSNISYVDQDEADEEEAEAEEAEGEEQVEAQPKLSVYSDPAEALARLGEPEAQ